MSPFSAPDFAAMAMFNLPLVVSSSAEASVDHGYIRTPTHRMKLHFGKLAGAEDSK
jgi:hypothetical protein